jgi:hypothetical protein
MSEAGLLINPKPPKRPVNWDRWLSILALAVATTAAAFTGYQAIEARRTRLDAAIAAKRAESIAEKSVGVAEVGNRNQERLQRAILVATLKLNNLHYTLSIENTSGNPALNVMMGYSVRAMTANFKGAVFAEDDPDFIIARLTRSLITPVIAAGKTFEVPYSFPSTPAILLKFPPYVVPQEYILVGVVVYNDLLSKKHGSPFCFDLSSSNRIHACEGLDTRPW